MKNNYHTLSLEYKLPISSEDFEGLSEEEQDLLKDTSKQLSVERVRLYYEHLFPILKDKEKQNLLNEEIAKIQESKFDLLNKLKLELSKVKQTEPISIDLEGARNLISGFNDISYKKICFMGEDGKFYILDVDELEYYYECVNDTNQERKIVLSEEQNKESLSNAFVEILPESILLRKDLDLFLNYKTNLKETRNQEKEKFLIHSSLPVYVQKKILLNKYKQELQNLLSLQLSEFAKNQNFIFQNKKTMLTENKAKNPEQIGFQKETMVYLFLSQISVFLKEKGISFSVRFGDFIEDKEMKCDIVLFFLNPGESKPKKFGIQVFGGLFLSYDTLGREYVDSEEEENYILHKKGKQIESAKEMFGDRFDDVFLFNFKTKTNKSFKEAFGFWANSFLDGKISSPFDFFDFLSEEEYEETNSWYDSEEEKELEINRIRNAYFESLKSILNSIFEKTGLVEYKYFLCEKINSSIK